MDADVVREGAARAERLEGRRLPWQIGVAPALSLAPQFFARPAAVVARDLLGAVLVSESEGHRTAGVIVETEAYGGAEDPASHAATVHGQSVRNRAMFGAPGRAYIYRIYGLHWCANVVTGAEGDPQAVLLRGIEPLEGEGVMSDRRGGRRPLGAGPGRLCAALAIDDRFYGHDLALPPLQIGAGWTLDPKQVGISGRIGVRRAAEWPLRFYVRGSSGVSGSGGKRTSSQG